ncbi:MAG TPA: DASS family sodium-coupled anion symporter [Sphingorhabdus sp.]|uniref:SLC13 family permease n=1 Tax=Sphingorhabdus sp. TaxID=1902408 RepID=UPI002CCACF39|nr:DASS family sodium-coupled anion symporter [Sphingorhabdus sp.]HMT40505.1 DASS family sodium-coupled anion symporter [Sphingorhabdus sp.]HMU21521.1 DASS family sodium-coupled anion symporter [Sphingorhabdus sp.]
MTTKSWGLWCGIAVFSLMLILGPPASMDAPAWHVAALTLLMAIWWMTEALPLTATALLPFLALPFMGVMTAKDVAKEYYSDILFLILGGAFFALAIERVGMHRRVALGILRFSGKSSFGLLLAFMVSTAFLSMWISNTSTSLIMMPIALAVLAAGGVEDEATGGMAGALILGIAFAASLGGVGTLVGSPTNPIATGLIESQLGLKISFLDWMSFGIPIVLISVPLTAFILAHVQKIMATPFDVVAAKNAIGKAGDWTTSEMRLLPLVLLVISLWLLLPQLESALPKGSITDGTIAIACSLLLFLVPDGSGRPLLNWKEADRAPWGVIMMFGGGLALAAGISESGLADWLGEALKPLAGVHPLIIAAAVTALVILITEFASNVATASGVMPVIAGLVAATGSDPWLLAMCASIAASWGFMMPSGTGPNAIAWATGHVALPHMLRAGVLIDLFGVPLIVGIVWFVATFH